MSGSDCRLSIEVGDDVEAVVLDLDGLLIDSETACYEVVNRILADAGTSMSRGEFATRVGSSARDLYSHIKLTHLPHWDVDELLARRESLLDSFYAAPVPMPGGVELVGLLRSVGIRVAVASSSPQHLVGAAVHGLGLSDHVEVVVGEGHPDVARLKPAPDLYLVALRELGTAARMSYAVEDSPIGAAAAIAAGLRTLVVPSEWTRHREFPSGVTRVESLDLISVRPRAG